MDLYSIANTIIIIIMISNPGGGSYIGAKQKQLGAVKKSAAK